MAKVICKSRLLHNGARFNPGDEIDTAEAKLDADLVKGLVANGVLVEVKAPAPAPAPAKAKPAPKAKPEASDK